MKGVAFIEHTKAETDQIKTSTSIRREDHVEDVKDRKICRFTLKLRVLVVLDLTSTIAQV